MYDIPRTAIGCCAVLPETLWEWSDNAWEDGHKVKSIAEAGLALVTDATMMFSFYIGAIAVGCIVAAKVQSITGR